MFKTLIVALSLICVSGIAYAQPGPAPADTAVADYDPVTGAVHLSFTGVNNWFLTSELGALLDADLPTGALPGALGSESDSLIGETAFAVGTLVDYFLGNVVEPGTSIQDLSINWNAGIGTPVLTSPLILAGDPPPFIPEPNTFILAALGLAGITSRRYLPL